MTRATRSKASATAASDENSVEGGSGGGGLGGRRSSNRARQQTEFFAGRKGGIRDDDDDDDEGEDEVDEEDDEEEAESEEEKEEEEEEAPSMRRKSSRSTAFRGEMKDPSNSIADLLKSVPDAAFGGGGNNGKKRRGARQRSSLETRSSSAAGEDSDDDDIVVACDSPPVKKKKAVVKSPAKRHSKRRMHKRVENPESSEDEMTSEDEDEDEEEEEEEMKINKIIACKSMTLSEWSGVCARMNTTEITNGSRWIQENATPSSSADASFDKYEERFLVKWNDLSHLHCSWETERDLVEFCEGAKGRLSTFFRKAEGGLLYRADERLDGDYFDPSWVTIERILEESDPDVDGDEPTEIILDLNHPKFDSGTGRQFYVKWVNRSYSESTFEFERDLILNEVDYEGHLALYNKRRVKPTREDMRRRSNESDAEYRRLYKIFGDKIKHSDEEKEKAVKEYQNALASRVFKNGGQLRDYQAEGVSWLMSNHMNKRSSILADEMGLGKTIQTATYVNTVSQHLATRGPFLVVAPLSTIPHWYREFTGWTDLNTIIYHGSANDRERAREDEFAFPEDRVEDVAFNQRYLMKVAKKWRSNWEKSWMVEVVITTPEMLVTDDFTELMAIKWEILVVDEAHRLKNHNSKLAQNLRDPRFEFKHSLLLTGTPIQNNMQELWTLLNFINPDSFDNIDEFMEQYRDIKSKEKVDELHEAIRPYILRRLKEDVEKSVPPKEETLIEVELTVLQKQYYRALYERNLKFLHRNKKSPIDGPSINNLAMQLRKCCNHPFLLTGVENEVRSQKPNTNDVDSLVNSSGKFVLLDKLLPRLKADGHRILLFSQFKIMLDIIEDYLHLRDFKCERIDGSITGMKRQAAIDRFQSKDNSGREQPFIMLLSTRAGGVGINLTAADTCIIFDSDWNPQNDLQAQARCHRIGQTKNVKIYRLLTRKTYEMQMFHMSSMKMGLDQAVLQGIENSGGKDVMTKEQIEKLLKHGAYDIFKEDRDGTSEKESNDFISQDIDSILARRAKTVVHENTGSNSNAAGGTFSKASFKNTNSDGIDSAEVDVDDPDFWTKVVGDAKEEEDPQLGKRKRAQHSYSEKEYLKRLDAQIKDGIVGSDVEDNASTSSEWSNKNINISDDESLPHDNEALRTIVKATKSKETERYQWGGSGRSEWKQSDAENVLKVLGSFGYGNISWARFDASLSLSKSMKLDEIKRMCWSLALLCLYEAAEDDALEITRKAETASKEKRIEGDILARSGNETMDLTQSSKKTEEKKDPLEESFRNLLAANESWVETALADALAFSKSVASHRDKQYVQGIIDGNRPFNDSNGANPVQSKLVADFVANVWPALRSRGWNEKSTNVFMYQGHTFKSIPTVLDAVPKYHPELTNMANSLISSVAASCKQTASTFDPVAKLDLRNVTAESLQLFLMDRAPMQLLADRKRANRIVLTKRLLSKLVLLHAVHKTVSIADSNSRPDDSSHERNLLLSKAITINSQSSLPHKEWTFLHDAILIRAVIKHGWLDSHATCSAIANDKTIRWGAPFEASDELNGKEQKKAEEDPRAETTHQAYYDDLYKTASRAVDFLHELNESFADGLAAPVLNEIREQLVISYGITHDESEDNWKVQESALQNIVRPAAEKATDEYEALPSRKRLIKRMKKLALSFAGNGSAPDDDKDDALQANPNIVTKVETKYGFCVINQNDRHNALLAAMLRGQLSLKQSTKPATKIKYSVLVFDEISARINDLARSDENGPLIQTLEKIRKDLQLYLNTFKKLPRASKNILRVMLGLDPVMPKVESEPLFASEEEKPSSASVAAKAAMTKLKNKKAFTPADTALNRALSFYAEDRDEVKDCLHLTSTEILMLTVLASQGLPVFSDDWNSLISSDALVADESNEDEDREEFRIFFFAMTQVMRAAADVWLGIARKKLRQAVLTQSDTNEVSEKDKEKIAVLKKDHDAKEMTLAEAKIYSEDPLLFAKRCIMLLEAIRKNMGPVDLQYAGEKKIRQLNKSENGLGTKVVQWFSKDLQKWAVPLGVVDEAGNVKSATSITANNDHPQSRDAALMTKRDCRTVYIQIAQQTRLRSIFSKHDMERLSTELIPKVLKQSSFNAVDWEESPTWWNVDMDEESSSYCQDDIDLLAGILHYGYGGFDSLLHHDYSFCRRLSAEGNESSTFTRSTVQVRINNLTRELHAIDESEEMMKLVQKKRRGEAEKLSINGKVKQAKKSIGGGIQSGLRAFFSIPSAGAKQNTPPTSPEERDSDIEIIEIRSDSSKDSKKRKKVFDCVEVTKKPFGTS